MKNKKNLMNTLDVETQLRHALKAVDELTLENKELTEQLNLNLVGSSKPEKQKQLLDNVSFLEYKHNVLNNLIDIDNDLDYEQSTEDKTLS